jgi:hypothetical protein
MTRLMYDGVRSLAAGIHHSFPNAAMVAGYDNGLYAWTTAEWNLFPHAVKVHISITASANTGDVLDVEQGDATPAQAKAWIEMRKRAGLYRPTIYCSRSVIPAVRQATGNLVLGRDYDIWAADYTGQPHQVVAPGTPSALCAATQYINTTGYDASVVYDDGWPHRSAPKPPAPKPDPAPAPASQPKETPEMIILRTKVNGAVVTFLYGAGGCRHITNPENQAALAKVLPVVDVTEDQVVKCNGGSLPPM